MKFKKDDEVRVIAWAVPGVPPGSEQRVVCGLVGVVTKVRAGSDKDNSDGNYSVDLNPREHYWFRGCDLVLNDSQCTCDNTIKKIAGVCLVHDRPDYDPTEDVAAKLETLVHDLEGE